MAGGNKFAHGYHYFNILWSYEHVEKVITITHRRKTEQILFQNANRLLAHEDTNRT